MIAGAIASSRRDRQLSSRSSAIVAIVSSRRDATRRPSSLRERRNHHGATEETEEEFRNCPRLEANTLDPSLSVSSVAPWCVSLLRREPPPKRDHLRTAKSATLDERRSLGRAVESLGRGTDAIARIITERRRRRRKNFEIVLGWKRTL